MNKVEQRGTKRWSTVCRVLMMVSISLFLLLMTGCESASTPPDISGAPEISHAPEMAKAPEIADAPVDLTPTNELVIYVSFLSESYLNPLIERYKAMYPDVNVTAEVIEGMDGYANRLGVELPAGKGTDVVFPALMWNSDISKLANSGAFLDMKSIIENDKDFNIDDYVKAAFDGGFFRGRQYLVPLTYTVGVYLSSTPQIEEIGFDLTKSGDMVSFINELVRCVPKAKENPEFQSVLTNDSFYNLVSASGIELVDFNYNKALPDEASLKKFLEAYKQYYPYDKQEYDTTDTLVAMQTGRRYFEYIFDMTFLDLAEMLKNSGGYETSVLHGMDGKLQGWSYNSVAIRSGSPNQLNAWNFIKLMLSPECQMPESGIFNLVGYPVLKAAVPYLAELKNSRLETPLPAEDVQAFVDIILNVDSYSLYPITATSAVRKHMEPWFKDEKSYDICLDALRNELTLYLSE